jgi:hypothetical protein
VQTIELPETIINMSQFRGAKTYQKPGSQLKILGGIRATSSNIHTDDPKILLATDLGPPNKI